MLKMHTDDYICARNDFMTRELIAFDGYLFQVFSLPANPVVKTPASQYHHNCQEKLKKQEFFQGGIGKCNGKVIMC